MIGTPARFEVERELQRRLAAVLHDHADRLFLVDDLEHVFQRQRLEVQAVGGVVVGRHGLRVAVDHDGLVAVLAHRERGVHAAVVELDALADAVRPAAQHHDLLARRSARPRTPRRRSSTGRRSASRTRRRRCRRACRPGARPARGARARTSCWSVPSSLRQALVGEALALQAAQLVASTGCRACGSSSSLLDLRRSARSARGTTGRSRSPRTPRRASCRCGRRRRRTGCARARRRRSPRRSRRGRCSRSVEAVDAGLEPAQRLLEALLEGAARSPSPRRPTSSASSGAGRPRGNFSNAKRGILVTT